VPWSPVSGTVAGVTRRLLVLACFCALALGVAYVGTGMLEGVLRAASPAVPTQEVPERVVSPVSDDAVPAPAVVVPAPADPVDLSPVSVIMVARFADDVADDVVTRLNAERAAAGLGPLQVDPVLVREARQWSEQMTRNGYVHSTMDRLTAISVELGGGGVAENLHAPEVQCTAALSCDLIDAHPTSGVLHVDWMNSAHHRSTMFDPAWDRVGVGVFCDASGKMWATTLFSAPPGVAVASQGVVPYREPAVAGNDGVTCEGSTRSHNPRWRHASVS